MNSSYLDTFRDEAGELLQELEAALLMLEEAPENAASIDLVFRILHTLKGSGAMAGCSRTAAFAHDIETLFELVRNGRCTVGSEQITTVLAALDLLRSTVAAEVAGTPVAAEALRSMSARLQTLAGQTGPGLAPPSLAPTAQSGTEELFLLRFRPCSDLLLRGIEPGILLQSLADHGDLLTVARQHAIPPLGVLNPETCHIFWDLLLRSDAGVKAIRDVFIFVEGDSEVIVQALAMPAELTPATAFAGLAQPLTAIGDLPVSHLVQFLEEHLRALVTSAGTLAARDDIGTGSAAARNSSIRVRSERLDRLVNLIGELVTIQARLSQIVGAGRDAPLEGLSEEIERLTWELRDEVLSIRMLPVGTTFGHLRRMVRDLATQLGKDVEFATHGAETELDKTVIERLQEPLMHLLRNSLDHGIEHPAERVAKGKTARGTIQVAAVHSGAEVIVSVSDDGSGLDSTGLLRRAVEMGLVESERGLGEREAQQLIFAPGFSTAREVTSVSGRGVGMDAVRRAIEGLRGRIEVHSVAGQGTTFAIHLPLTLAIIDGLLVRVGNEQYVIPLGVVEECVELGRAESGSGSRLLPLRGTFIPYLRLREQFDCAGVRPRVEQVVVTNCDGQRVGLVVDDVIGSHQTVIKPMGKLVQEQPGFSGATVLGSGQLALILDVAQLVGDQLAFEFRATGT